jgi:hypothetical protein
VTYLDELLVGYQQGLARNPLLPIQALRATLAETDDARQRGRLLGLIAQTLAERVENRSVMCETPSRRRSIT